MSNHGPSLRSVPFGCQSLYIIRSHGIVLQYQLQKNEWEKLQSLPKGYHYVGGVIYKNHLTVIQSDMLLTYENRRWVIRRYKKLDGMTQVMIYNDEIHACVTTSDGCKNKVMKYDSGRNLWEDTNIPAVPCKTQTS